MQITTLESYTKVVELNSKNADGVYGIGLVYIARQEFAKASEQQVKLQALDVGLAAKLKEKIDKAAGQ